MPEPPPAAADAAERDEVDPTAEDVPEPEGTTRRPRRRRRWLRPLLAIVAVVAAFLVVTGFTGFPGPGALHRYPNATLDDLVDAIHADAGDVRTPDDCWRTTYRATIDAAPTGPERPIASIDHLRSRVVVRVYADQIGRVDPRTAASVDRRLAQIVRDDPRFEPGMLITEPSPDGWSPLMSCPLVVRGWF